MAVVHGNAVGIYVDADAGGATESSKLVACSTSATFSLENSSVEAVCKADSTGELTDASVRHTLAGQQSWSMSVEGLVDLTTGGASLHSFVDLMELANDRTTIGVVFRDALSTKTYSGNGFISSIEATASVDDFVTYSCTIEGTGLVTIA
jgi:predicted secreted protein